MKIIITSLKSEFSQLQTQDWKSSSHSKFPEDFLYFWTKSDCKICRNAFIHQDINTPQLVINRSHRSCVTCEIQQYSTQIFLPKKKVSKTANWKSKMFLAIKDSKTANWKSKMFLALKEEPVIKLNIVYC